MHTPGPWEVSRDAVPESHAQFTVYEEAKGERVATAFVSKANAQLIAAAPEMYVLLCNVRDILAELNQQENDEGELLDAIDATLEKATEAQS